MGLRPDRSHLDSLIDYFMNETATRGGVVVQSTVGSGSAMDNSSQLATYAENPSGKTPLGVLMTDVVNLDLIRQHINQHKEEVNQGQKVTIWSKCVVTTDMILDSETPAVNTAAYLAHSGKLAASDQIGGGEDLRVGRWLSSKDEDGYAKVSVNLPLR